jgi:mono/diheme cytochrome c family protein
VLAVIKTKSSLTSNAAGGSCFRGSAAYHSHLASFAVSKGERPSRQRLEEEGKVIRGLALMIGLLAGLAPAVAHAQTSIDQGKSPALIFSETCAACHSKGARGLANGKGSYALTDFLLEHYTTGREQAAALAAYVLGAGRGPKPQVERPTNAAADPKTNNRQTRKPEEAAPPANAKLQSAPGEEPKSRDGGIATEEPSRTGREPVDKRRDMRPATATRGHHREPETPLSGPETGGIAREPASLAREPSADASPHPAEAPSPDAGATPSATVSTDSAAGDTTPVPRDNIPD